jgi:hypothetical protein
MCFANLLGSSQPKRGGSQDDIIVSPQVFPLLFPSDSPLYFLGAFWPGVLYFLHISVQCILSLGFLYLSAISFVLFHPVWDLGCSRFGYWSLGLKAVMVMVIILHPSLLLCTRHC